jgi:hypothetical protein
MSLINRGKLIFLGVESMRVLKVSLATVIENKTVNIVNMIETIGSKIDNLGLK